MGQFAIPQKTIDEEIVRLCDGVRFNMDVIETVNRNKLYMTGDELRIVLNTVKGMYQGMKGLILNYASLTDYGLEVISEALKHNGTVTKVDLSTNEFTDLGMRFLGEALRSNRSVLSLKLGFNKLKDKACEYLYEGLKENSTLSQLHLENNQITNDGARFLAMSLLANKYSALTHIYLDHNLIDDEGADHLSTALRNNRSLQYIYMNNNKIT